MGEVGPIKIASVSGKGGVGKTTLTFGVSRALRDMGFKVGVIDLDLDSSSLGDVAGLTHDKLAFNDKIEPVEVSGIWAVSLSMFNAEGWEDTPTLLSEENVGKVVRQLFVSINWPALDFLIIDNPPGTGVALRALLKQSLDGLLLVTAQQRVSEMPVRRLIRMARDEFPVEIIGIVDNDPYNASSPVHSADLLAQRYGLPVLGVVSWDPAIAQAMDARTPLPVEKFAGIAKAIAAHYAARLGGDRATTEQAAPVEAEQAPAAGDRQPVGPKQTPRPVDPAAAGQPTAPASPVRPRSPRKARKGAGTAVA